MKNILACLFLVLISFKSTSQENKKISKEIERYLSSRYKENQPGIAVLVSKHDKILYKNGFGMANLEWQIPVETNTVFQIGSVTKLFTALAILQLVEKEKLVLTDSIQKYIPTFPNKGYSITIEQLLTHSSGIKDYMQMDSADPFIMRKDFTIREVIDFFKEEPLAFEPGTRSSYSSSGTFLLGSIIENVSGMSYQQYIEEHIFKKADMTNSYYGANSKVIPNRATSYALEKGDYVKGAYRSMTIPYSAGALLSTVEDMYKWHRALYNYELLGEELLTKATTTSILKNGNKGIFGYGGWFVNHIQLKGSNATLAHSGGISSFNSFLMYMPNEDIFVVVLSNFKNSKVQEITEDLSTLALGGELASNDTNEDLLNSFKGRYKPSDGSSKIVEIKEIEKKLIFNMVGEFKLELVSLAQNTFLLKNARPKATLEFIQDQSGNTTKLIVNQGKPYEWIKIK